MLPQRPSGRQLGTKGSFLSSLASTGSGLLWRQIASSPAAQCCCRDDTRAQPGKNIRKRTTPNSGCVTSCVGKALRGRFLLSFARRSVEGAQSCVRLAANVTVPGVRLRITGAAAELRHSRVLANLRSGRDLDELVNDVQMLHTNGLHQNHAHVSRRSSAVSVVTRLKQRTRRALLRNHHKRLKGMVLQRGHKSYR